MSGPTGAVKSFSVPGFTLKTDMSPMGETAKAKETEKAAAAAIADGFEAPKAKKAEEPAAMAKAAAPDFVDDLRNLIHNARAEVNTWSDWNPLKHIALALLDRAEALLNQVDQILQNGGVVGQAIRDAITWVSDQIKNLLGG